MRANSLIPIALALLASACTSSEVMGDDRQWISLFNGKDLDGWDIKFAGHEVGENYKDTFRAEDGILSVNYDQYASFDGKFGHIFYREVFSDYIIRLEYRMVGEQAPGAPAWAFKNNGIMLHSQSAQSMGLDQAFPRAIEAQLVNGGDVGERPNGNVCTPGTDIRMGGKLVTEHCINSSATTNRGTDWVSVEIEVRNNQSIRHVINGVVTMEYSHLQVDITDQTMPTGGVEHGAPLTAGYIALQAESHPTEFRNIMLLDLSN